MNDYNSQCPCDGVKFKVADNSHSVIELALASLDTDFDLMPNVHIHLSTKVNWLYTNDDLVKLSNGRNE